METSLTYKLFQSDNELEVPTLRLDRQPNVCDIPFLAYGEQSRKTQMNGYGTLHFYVDDYRFNTIYDHPNKIVEINPKNIVEPNYSLYCETPIALGLQHIYKKRAIARYCQDHGIGVFVDLNVNHKFYKLNMLGVPRGYSSFCTRGYVERLEYLEFEYNVAKEWSEDNPLLFVVFGGGNKCREFAAQHNCIYITPQIKLKADEMRYKKIEQEVAGSLFDSTGLIVPKNLPMYDFRASVSVN